MAAILMTYGPDAHGGIVSVSKAERLCLEDRVTEPSQIHECASDLLNEGFASIDVDLGSRITRFTCVTSSEDAIARVEQHLRGGKHDHTPLLPTRHGVL